MAQGHAEPEKCDQGKSEQGGEDAGLVERGIISASSARYRDETLVKPRVHKLRILQQDVCKQDGRSAATDKVYERTLGRCEDDHVPSQC